ncbi:MAG TPA: hypothetical protein VNB49_15005, partial [Candidatus Dormibacteraeota bacterium]|nr:hypothetical protein [Candidatus Dormibacteraeota bacterium]
KRVIFTCGEQPTALLRLTLDVQAREVYCPSGWALSLGSVVLIRKMFAACEGFWGHGSRRRL